MMLQLSSLFSKMDALTTSDHASVVSMNMFVALLCGCIVIGHLLEENRWMNESITALVIVSPLFYTRLIRVRFKSAKFVVRLKIFICLMSHFYL